MLAKPVMFAATLFLASSCSLRDVGEAVFSPDRRVGMVQPELGDVTLDALWGKDWRREMEVEWDEQAHGPLGYTQPDLFQATYFHTGEHTPLGWRLMPPGGMRLQLEAGSYDFFVRNDDFEYTQIQTAPDWSGVAATTPPLDGLQLPDSLGCQGPLTLMPEQLFSLMDRGHTITGRKEDYKYLPGEDIYVLPIKERLRPRTFVYLLQIRIENNNGRVGNCTNVAVDGLAAGTELISGHALPGMATHQMPAHHYTKGRGDERKEYYMARLVTYGLPGPSPASRAAGAGNRCHIQLYYSNGAHRYISADITEAMRSKPTGGIVGIAIDIDKEPGHAPHSPEGGDEERGGMHVGVGEWTETDHFMEI